MPVDVEKLELTCVSRNATRCSQCGAVKHRVTMQPSSSVPKYLTKRSEGSDLMVTSALATAISESNHVHQETSRQDVVHTHNRVVLCPQENSNFDMNHDTG